jgi:hypothetical protein
VIRPDARQVRSTLFWNVHHKFSSTPVSATIVELGSTIARWGG